MAIEHPQINKEEHFKHSKNDLVNSPKHYVNHPSGVECIEIAGALNFCLGNAFKYIFRRKYKGSELTDLKKALWYVKYEIKHNKLNTNSYDFTHLAYINMEQLNKVIIAENQTAPINTFGKILANLVDGKNLELVQKMLAIEIANLQKQLELSEKQNIKINKDLSPRLDYLTSNSNLGNKAVNQITKQNQFN